MQESRSPTLSAEERPSSTGKASRAAVITLFLLVGLYLGWGALYVVRTSFVIDGERVFCLWDDGMVSMQYARNLARGDGPVWNPGGERVQGFSNPGVTSTMALIHLLPIAASRTALVFQLLNLAILGIVLVLVWRITSDLFGEPWVSAGAVAAVAAFAPLAVWSLQGSDAGFVALWLLTCVAALSRQKGPDAVWPKPLFWLLAAGLVLRLDVAIYYVLFLAVSLAYPGRRWRRLAYGALLLVAVEATLAGASYLYYGDPLPNTYYLKATGSPRWFVLASGFEQMARLLPGLLPALILAGVAYRSRRRDPVVVVSLLAASASLAYAFWVGGDWAFEWGNRFAVPSLPLLLLLAVGGAFMLLERSRFLAGSRAAPALLLVTAMVLGVLATPRTARVEWYVPTSMTMYRDYNALFARFAGYLRRRADPSTSLGVHYAGVLPYFSELFAIDMLGKSDRHIARMEVPRFIPAHSKWDWDYVVNQRKPDIIVGASRGIGGLFEFRDGYYQGEFLDRQLLFFIRKSSLEKLDHEELILEDLWTEERFPKSTAATRLGDPSKHDGKR